MKKFLTLTAIVASLSLPALAQDSTVTIKKHSKMYTTSTLDGAIFSMNTVQTNGITNVLRFSYFINSGMAFNYDFNRHVGVYVGIGVKNMGYIEKGKEFLTPTTFRDITVKHRVYAAGIPVGVKFGNLGHKGTFGLLGGGVDFPINYKEKTFNDGRKNKTKMNEWFSDRTEHIMPYVFAGISIKSGLTFKAQYYPGNFMNRDYTKNGVKLYDGFDTHLAMLSVSYYVKGKKDKGNKDKFKVMMKNRKK